MVHTVKGVEKSNRLERKTPHYNVVQHHLCNVVFDTHIVNVAAVLLVIDRRKKISVMTIHKKNENSKQLLLNFSLGICEPPKVFTKT